MNRQQYIQLTRQEAQKVLKKTDYKKLIAAAKTKKYVNFSYTNKEDTKKKYTHVKPVEFFFTPKWSEPPPEGAVYLWAYHKKHNKNHSFRADRIKKVNYMATIIEALTDPYTYKEYWMATQD
jgi:predicted DNA-binding transcriptional regulator YafY